MEIHRSRDHRPRSIRENGRVPRLIRFPVWIWAGDPCFYGFPSFGEPTIKVARDTSNNFAGNLDSRLAKRWKSIEAGITGPDPYGKTAGFPEFHAAKVILATDAWTNKLLAPLGIHIPLTVMQEQGCHEIV
jgi:hypothetical protein